MACNCKNPDGTLTLMCMGTCHPPKNIEERLEYTLAVFLSNLDVRIFKLERLIEENYKTGFKDGFELYREIYDEQD